MQTAHRPVHPTDTEVRLHFGELSLTQLPCVIAAAGALGALAMVIHKAQRATPPVG